MDLSRLSCPACQSLVDFSEGRLPDSKLVQISQHLEDCSVCCSEMAKIHRRSLQSGWVELLRSCLSPGVGYFGESGTSIEREIAARNIHLEESREEKMKLAG